MTDKPDKQWKRSDNVTISDEGSNTVPNRFDGEYRAVEHYKRHRDDYPELTQAQYVQRAANLASSEVKGAIIGFSSDDGCVIRYDKQANDFAKAYPGTDGYVRTLYKPSRGIEYYHDEKKRSWKFRKGVKK